MDGMSIYVHIFLTGIHPRLTKTSDELLISVRTVEDFPMGFQPTDEPSVLGRTKNREANANWKMLKVLEVLWNYRTLMDFFFMKSSWNHGCISGRRAGARPYCSEGFHRHRRELQGWSQQLQGPRCAMRRPAKLERCYSNDWWVTGVPQQCDLIDLIPKHCVKQCVWQWQFGNLLHLQTQTFSGYDQQGHQRRGVSRFFKPSRWGNEWQKPLDVW